MLEMRPPRIRRVAHIRKGKLSIGSQVFRVTDDALLQRPAGLRRKRQHIMRPLLEWKDVVLGAEIVRVNGRK
jgi:hypothetical protein